MRVCEYMFVKKTYGRHNVCFEGEDKDSTAQVALRLFAFRGSDVHFLVITVPIEDQSL